MQETFNVLGIVLLVLGILLFAQSIARLLALHLLSFSVKTKVNASDLKRRTFKPAFKLRLLQLQSGNEQVTMPISYAPDYVNLVKQSTTALSRALFVAGVGLGLFLFTNEVTVNSNITLANDESKLWSYVALLFIAIATVPWLLRGIPVPNSVQTKNDLALVSALKNIPRKLHIPPQKASVFTVISVLLGLIFGGISAFSGSKEIVDDPPIYFPSSEPVYVSIFLPKEDKQKLPEAGLFHVKSTNVFDEGKAELSEKDINIFACKIQHSLAKTGTSVALIIGRHDKEPLTEEAEVEFYSNSGLAQARAEYVSEHLLEKVENCGAPPLKEVVNIIAAPRKVSLSGLSKKEQEKMKALDRQVDVYSIRREQAKDDQ